MPVAVGNLFGADMPAAPATSPADNIAPEVHPQYWFGVAVENISPTIAKQLKLRADQGLMVVAVLPQSPADKAGLKEDDILIELDGTPLTSQEDLAVAANTARGIKSTDPKVTAVIGMKTSHITYLREGSKKSLNITPEMRPESMLVKGANVDKFSPQGVQAGGGKLPAMTPNIVMPNGTLAQVGTGYAVPMNTRGASATVQNIRQLVSNGDSVVLSQETDSAGHIKNRIVVGTKAYLVEAGKIDSLPEDLRPLARQMLDVNAAAAAPSARLRFPVNSLERRIAELEKTNAELKEQNLKTQQQLQDVIELLKKQSTGK